MNHGASWDNTLWGISPSKIVYDMQIIRYHDVNMTPLQYVFRTPTWNKKSTRYF